MKKIDFFQLLSSLFDFKTISDEMGNEFVLFSQNRTEPITSIKDRTEFEALENHVHLLDNIKKDEFEKLIPIAENLGSAILNSLKCRYPNKNFIVFVSICLNDSMIIRFHQKWDGEDPYYITSEFTSPKEKIISFEG